MKWIVLAFILSGCQKPVNYDDLPQTKYPETPVNGAWEEFKP